MMFITLIPLIASVIMFGWGDILDPAYAMLRFLLIFLPYIRLSSFMVLIVYMTKSPYPVMVVGLFYKGGMALLTSLMKSTGAYVCANSNIQALISFGKRSTYTLTMAKGIEAISAYDALPDKGLIPATIGVSFLLSFVFLMLAYGVFRRDDLR
jgi:hypothetical protein